MLRGMAGCDGGGAFKPVKRDRGALPAAEVSFNEAP